MDKKTSGLVAVVLGVLGLVLILAGPVFQLLPTTIGIFGGLICWVGAVAMKGLGKKKLAEPGKEIEGRKEEGEEEEE